MKRILVLAAAAAVTLPGCNTFYAEAEQPSACLTLQPQSFTIPGGGIVAPPGGFTGTYTGSVDLGLSNVIPDFLLKGPSTDRVLHFLSFEASVSTAGANLDLLQSLEVTATGAPGSTPVGLGHYLRGTQTGVTRISIDSDNPGVNLADLMANGGLTLGVSGVVSVPGGQTVPTTWTAQVSTCISAKIHKTLEQIINGG